MENRNEEQAKRFLKIVADNYNDCLKKWRKHQLEKQIEFDEDIFQDSILKVYDKILRDGINEDTEQGYLNYFFKSFIFNSKREHQYSRVAYRDRNFDMLSFLENQDNGDSDIMDKRREEAWQQFVAYNILRLVEENFDTITFRCFRIYYLTKKMSYAKLVETTKIKDAKKRVVNTKKWIQENVDKQELIQQFNNWFEENNDLIW